MGWLVGCIRNSLLLLEQYVEIRKGLGELTLVPHLGWQVASKQTSEYLQVKNVLSVWGGFWRFRASWLLLCYRE